MNDHERLQTIKECDLVGVIISIYEGKPANLKAVIDEVNWLIEQAEKLEKELSVFNIQGMKEKIERYEKALKDVVDNYGKISPLGLLEITQKALKD
jgi:hypothetical protein